MMAVNGMARILDWTRLRLWRLLVRTGLAGEVHYINGPETLPAPLTPEEEAELDAKLDRILAGDYKVVGNLIPGSRIK